MEEWNGQTSGERQWLNLIKHVYAAKCFQWTSEQDCILPQLHEHLQRNAAHVTLFHGRNIAVNATGAGLQSAVCMPAY